MLAIVIRYRKHDCTLAALAVARYLDMSARRYTLIRLDWRAGSIDPAYDNKVHQIPFGKWLPKISHVLWTIPADEFYISYLREHKVRNTLYISWDQVERYDEKALSLYTHVLVPSLIQAMQLRDTFNIRNVAVLPYDSGLPHTLKLDSNGRNDGKIRLFLSLYGLQLGRVDLASFFVLSSILKDVPNLHVTVGCSKGLAPFTKRDLIQLHKRFGPRWMNLWDCPWYEQAVQMGEHDLTIWPARWDGFGIVGSTSLAMGTPVVSWDVTPINEYLSAGRNSLLVPCDVEYNWLGMPKVKPDYEEFNRILRWLVSRPQDIAELRRHTAEKLESRRVDFRKGWDVVLPSI